MNSEKASGEGSGKGLSPSQGPEVYLGFILVTFWLLASIRGRGSVSLPHPQPNPPCA